jgi:hypothetical protein
MQTLSRSLLVNGNRGRASFVILSLWLCLRYASVRMESKKGIYLTSLKANRIHLKGTLLGESVLIIDSGSGIGANYSADIHNQGGQMGVWKKNRPNVSQTHFLVKFNLCRGKSSTHKNLRYFCS